MSDCKSCSTKTEQVGKFCSSCGAKIVSQRLTIRRISSEAIKLITNLETPFIHTTKSLILNTKEVTLDYIDGKRKVISSPIRYATIALTIYGVFQFVFRDFITMTLEVSFLDNLIAGFSQGAEVEGRELNNISEIQLLVKKHNQFTNLFVAPFMAFLCLKFIDPPVYNYAEHLSISIYAVSLSLLLSSILGIVMGAFKSEAIVHTYIFLTLIINCFFVIRVIWKSYNTPLSSAIGFFLSSYLLVSVALFIILFILA